MVVVVVVTTAGLGPRSSLVLAPDVAPSNDGGEHCLTVCPARDRTLQPLQCVTQGAGGSASETVSYISQPPATSCNTVLLLQGLGIQGWQTPGGHRSDGGLPGPR